MPLEGLEIPIVGSNAAAGPAATPGFEVALYDLDIGSAGGARWSGDECGDPLGRDVQRAIDELLDTAEIRTPNGEVLTGTLLGEGHNSPSFTWHAQAIASLVELGFTPTAPCLWPHLDVIRARLDEGNYFDPSLQPSDPQERERLAGWQLRCRHLAWVVACMSEYQPVTPNNVPEPHGAEHHVGESQPKPRWDDRSYRELLRSAYDGLVGSPNASSSPSSWVAPRRDKFELFWHEMWPTPDPDNPLERRPNILSTIYAILALCRAERHGFGHYQGPWHALVYNEQTPSALVDHLLTQVVVRCGVGGPTVRLREPGGADHAPAVWTEPWAKFAHCLPPSVLGLIALTFVEYARFLAQISPASDRAQVTAAFLKAQRVAHALISRPAFMGVPWSRAADAFFQYGEDRMWFVPTYSVCARALLETGVAGPTHPLVEDAIDTIRVLTVEDESRPGRWLDPTYHTGLDSKATERAHGTTYTRAGSAVLDRGTGRYGRPDDEPGAQHASLDVREHASGPNGTDGWRATAASIHAAALAYAALRRAWGRVDPREPPESRRASAADGMARRRPTRDLPRSPFDKLVVLGHGEKGDVGPWLVTLTRTDAPAYEEHAEITPTVFTLLRNLHRAREREHGVNSSVRGLLLGELARMIHTKDDRPDQAVIRRRIGTTNDFFGFELIVESEPESDRFELDRNVGVVFSTRRPS